MNYKNATPNWNLRIDIDTLWKNESPIQDLELSPHKKK